MCVCVSVSKVERSCWRGKEKQSQIWTMSRNLDFLLWARGELLKRECHDMICAVEWSLARVRGMSWREGKARSREQEVTGCCEGSAVIIWLDRPSGCIRCLQPVLMGSGPECFALRIEKNGWKASKHPGKIDIKKDSWGVPRYLSWLCLPLVQVVIPGSWASLSLCWCSHMHSLSKMNK